MTLTGRQALRVLADQAGPPGGRLARWAEAGDWRSVELRDNGPAKRVTLTARGRTCYGDWCPSWPEAAQSAIDVWGRPGADWG